MHAEIAAKTFLGRFRYDLRETNNCRHKFLGLRNKNKLRRKCSKLLTSWVFEVFIQITVFVNCYFIATMYVLQISTQNTSVFRSPVTFLMQMATFRHPSSSTCATWGSPDFTASKCCYGYSSEELDSKTADFFPAGWIWQVENPKENFFVFSHPLSNFFYSVELLKVDFVVVVSMIAEVVLWKKIGFHISVSSHLSFFFRINFITCCQIRVYYS